jgi:hypothetical protein
VIEPALLVTDLQQRVRELERDLLERAESDTETDNKLRQRHRTAGNRSRTGLSFEAWRAQQLTQVAAGWVIACVSTRFCEDNGLLTEALLAGPGDRLAEARERQLEYFRQHPAHSDLDYLHAAVQRLSDYEPTRALADRHNPMHLLDPSPDKATELLEFWRRIDPETGKLQHDFSDPRLSTRFLGDLYQDLSPQAQEDYALKQTPEFVEEFILDRTLNPAIGEFGLADIKLIDPACGSGHFLLGAFARLLARWRDQEPGTNVRVLVERVLDQVHGVDINPYATAIARFRLVVAALTACEIEKLADCPAWRIPVAIGDSLRFGVRAGQLSIEGVTEHVLAGTSGEGEFVYEYEDAAELERILGQRYHAVVANPPYITVKDPVLNGLYRELWSSCYRSYHLSVPFAQRIYDLTVDGGFTGQITDNAFMKREFGRKLIEQFYASVDLNLVIDTSGAYIPGHGTPTVIICGRNRRPIKRTVRAVLGIRGEDGAPPDPATGRVWTSIVNHFEQPGAQTDWVSVTDLDRSVLAKYPWSLSGGGANELQERIEQAGRSQLGDLTAVIGRTTHTGSDEAFYSDKRAPITYGFDSDTVPVVLGEGVRDYVINVTTSTIFPYDDQGDPRDLVSKAALRRLWPLRSVLSVRRDYEQSITERGLRWFDHSMFFPERYRTPMSIAFAFVATHNHFVLDRGGKVFNRTAPVIKLPDGATEQAHLRLLGLLSSSTACFWLKQVSFTRGEGGGARVDAGYAALGSESWKNAYEFTGTKLEQFPLPAGMSAELAARLDALATELGLVTPTAVAADAVPARTQLDVARAEWERIRGEMISAQEELDWQIYGLYGLLGDEADSLVSNWSTPPLRLGERAFEIALARKVESGDGETEWFTRHRSLPITELPADWPAEYRMLIKRRLVKIESDPYLHLIERPACKRRWATDTWEQMEREALRDWLCARLEDRAFWFRPDPELRSVAQLADALRRDADFVMVARLYLRDADLTDVVAELVKGQHVPFLATFRYTESGMRIWRQWEQTWELQHQEDAARRVGDIPAPPKYRQGDFRDQAYWRNRGKLDVPKERFISYPQCSRDGTLLLGWAGWNHLQQAQAVAAFISERRELDAWDAGQLAPLLAGLAELLPWLRQWHGEIDPAFGQSPAGAYEAFLEQQLLALRLTSGDLAAVKPQPVTRGRRAGRRAAS